MFQIRANDRRNRMKNRSRILVAGIAAALLTLLVGAAFAMAEDVPQGQAENGDFQGQGPRARHLAAGEVVKVEGDTITIKTLRNGEEKSFKVNDETKYRKDGADATLADVAAGEKIGIALGEKPAEGQDPVAKAVLIGKPGEGPRGERGTPVVGTVSSLNGDTLTIATENGDKQVKLPAITNGMRIAVMTGDDGTVRGVIYNPPERPAGAQAPEDGAAGEPTEEPGAAT